MFFWSSNAPELIWNHSPKNVKFRIFIKISSFFRHISWPEQVFPSCNWAHIDSAQSFKIVFNKRLRICQSVKYFYQKYRVKGSKLCTSAGTPKASRRPVQGQKWRRVLRTTWLDEPWAVQNDERNSLSNFILWTQEQTTKKLLWPRQCAAMCGKTSLVTSCLANQFLLTLFL